MLRRVFLAAILVLTGLPVLADRLGDVVTWPAGPAVLKTGNQVRVQWYYLIEDRNGAQMFARPLKNGAPAAGYAASGSPLYRGEGQATAEFTLQGPGEVDAIRIQIIDRNRNVRHQTVVPVELRFAENPLGSGSGATLHVIPGAIRPLERAQPPSHGDVTADIRTIRPLLPADRLRPLLNRDLFTRLTPAMPDNFSLPGSDMTLRQTLATVPPAVDADADAVDAAWVAQLESWLHHITLMQGFDIMRLMGDSAEFDQYMQMEQADSPSVYEMLDRRRMTIGNLLNGL